MKDPFAESRDISAVEWVVGTVLTHPGIRQGTKMYLMN